MSIDSVIAEIEGFAERTTRNSAHTAAGKAALTREINAYRAAVRELKRAQTARRAFSSAYVKWLQAKENHGKTGCWKTV